MVIQSSVDPTATSLNRRVGRSFAAVAIGVLSVACSTSTSTGPSTPASSGYDGQWTGTTSQGTPITFSVVNQRVTTITFDYNFQGCAGAKTFSQLQLLILNLPADFAFASASQVQIVPAGTPSFTYGSNESSGPNLTQLIGAFTSTNVAVGQLLYGGYSCSQPQPGFTIVDSLVWNASRS
jgi:hypothetical protein